MLQREFVERVVLLDEELDSAALHDSEVDRYPVEGVRRPPIVMRRGGNVSTARIVTITVSAWDPTRALAWSSASPDTSSGKAVQPARQQRINEPGFAPSDVDDAGVLRQAGRLEELDRPMLDSPRRSA